jgi:hypothetical protein
MGIEAGGIEESSSEMKRGQRTNNERSASVRSERQIGRDFKAQDFYIMKNKRALAGVARATRPGMLLLSG